MNKYYGKINLYHIGQIQNETLSQTIDKSQLVEKSKIESKVFEILVVGLFMIGLVTALGYDAEEKITSAVCIAGMSALDNKIINEVSRK